MHARVALPGTANRKTFLVSAALLVIAIAATDWLTKPYISIGFLYLFPIMIAGGLLSRAQTVVVALVCAVLQEAFSNLPENEAIARLIFSSTGFVATGLLVAELVRNRRIALAHVVELQDQVKLRQDAEQQVRILVESSPAAIVVVDWTHKILLANEAAQQVLAPEGTPLPGQSISTYLPSLQAAMQTHPSRFLRTAMQYRGQRANREAFLAGVWFSTYETIAGPRLAAIIVDLSEDLRSREALSFDHLLKHARIVMSALAHEILDEARAVRARRRCRREREHGDHAGSDDAAAIDHRATLARRRGAQRKRAAADRGPRITTGASTSGDPLGGGLLALDDAEDVALFHDDEILTIELDLRAGPLAE